MKKFLGLLLLLAVVALIVALLYFKGFGGLGKNSGEDKNNDTSVSDTADKNEPTTEAATEDETIKAEITVSGHDYLFNNEKMSLDALAAEIAKLDKEAEITITADDTAAKNTVDELTDKLDELGYKNYKKLDK